MNGNVIAVLSKREFAAHVIWSRSCCTVPSRSQSQVYNYGGLSEVKKSSLGCLAVVSVLVPLVSTEKCNHLTAKSS